MRNEKLGTDTTALQFDFDVVAGYADVNVSVAGGTPVGSLRIYANGTISPPSYTTAERDALSSPVAGQLVFNTTTSKLNIYTDEVDEWQAFTAA